MDSEKINSREFAKRVINYKNDKDIYNELQLIHYQLFNKYFQRNCGQCVKKAYVNIREKLNMVITNQTKKQMGKFELKKSESGTSKQIHADHNVYTNDNLTDEIAIKILTKYPAHIVTFSRYPENWKELTTGVKSESKKETVEIEVETVDQFQQEVGKKIVVKKAKKK